MKKCIGLFVLIVFYVITATPGFAELKESTTFTGIQSRSNDLSTKNNFLFIGLKTRLDWWTVSKEDQSSLMDDKVFTSYPIEKRKSDTGMLAGPEIVYIHEKLFIRGFYLISKNNFAGTGHGERKNLGVDVGIVPNGYICLGYRRLDVNFSDWQSPNISEHTISDVTIGVLLRSRPEQRGFNASLDMIFGVKALLNVWDEKDYLENPTIIEGGLTVGHRGKKWPINISAGYEVWMYGKSIRKYTETNNLGSWWDPVIWERQHIERWENWGHGATLKVEYCF